MNKKELIEKVLSDLFPNSTIQESGKGFMISFAFLSASTMEKLATLSRDESLDIESFGRDGMIDVWILI